MTTETSKARILIVEDESIVAADIEEGLKSTGYDIVGIAANGIKAIELTEKHSPDLVLMDIRLQGEMTGIEAAREIGTRFQTPVIYLTAHSDDMTLQQAKLTQPYAYLLKPFGQRELRAVIETSIYKAQAEKKLAESERWNRLIIESAHSAFVSIDAEGIISDWNSRAETIFGWSKAEAIGRKLAETIIPENFREAHTLGLKHYLATGEGPMLNKVLEFLALHRDGHEFPIELTIATAERNNQPQFLAFVRDISDRKRFEAMQKRKAELERSNAELERFAHITSHDLQEPIRTVSMYTQLLTNQIKGHLNPEQMEFVGHIVNGAGRMQQLIQDLLAYSRLSASEKDEVFEKVDTGIALTNALEDLQQTINESKARLIYEALPSVSGHSNQVTQLFQNLIGNAIKYKGKENPEIHISAKREGDFWLFSVSDNGIGFDGRYAKQIFEMFKRLYPNDQYPGTGMGLAICKKIVDLHGGRIWAESTPNHGSTFFFLLPAAEAMAKTATR